MATPSAWAYVSVTLTDPPPVVPAAPVEPVPAVPVATWHGPRDASWRVELLDMAGRVLPQTLPTKSGSGSLDWQADRSSTGAAKVTLQGALNPRDLLLGRRLRPVYTLNGIDYPQGIYKATRTPTGHSGGGTQTHDVALVDASAITGNTVGSTTYPTATNIVAKVRSLAAIAGTPITIADSDATLRTEMSWPDNTPIVKIVGDLLTAAGFTPLVTNTAGILQSGPYVPAAARPVVYDFRNNAEGIYEPRFSTDSNWANIPNRVRVVARSSSEADALIGYATDENPASPWSRPTRGEWVEQSFADVDATSQEALNLIAARKLAEAQQEAATLTFQCAWIPQLALGAVIGFHNTAHDMSGLWEVTAMSWAMTPTARVSVTARSVS